MHRRARLVTTTALFAIGALHAMWGRGSTFPFGSRERLNDTVIGRTATPGPAACYVVAGMLAAAGALVAGLPSPRSRVRRVGVLGVTFTLGLRAALGFAGKTELVSPGSVSPRFRQTDRRVLSPLCTALAIGAVSSLGD